MMTASTLITASPSPSTAKVILETSLEEFGDRYVHGMGFSPMVAPTLMCSVELVYDNHFHKGVGVRNDNGGMEVWAPGITDRFFTVREPGVLTVPVYRNGKTSACCLFADILDYLSYLSLASSAGSHLPRGCDAIIMNDFRNFASMVVDSDEYAYVHCLFPQDAAGRTMEKTILRRNDRAHSSVRNYRGFTSLYEKFQQTCHQ